MFGIKVWYQVGEEVAVASFFLSLKYPEHYLVFGWLHLLLGAGCAAGCREGAGPGFRFVLFCLQIMMKIEILNSRKNRSTLTLSLSHLCSSK